MGVGLAVVVALGVSEGACVAGCGVCGAGLGEGESVMAAVRRVVASGVAEGSGVAAPGAERTSSLS